MGQKTKAKERLEEICRLYPERFFKDGIFDHEKAKDIYLPDRNFKREKSYYAQIMKAVRNRKELLPASVCLSDAEIQVCFKELILAKLICVSNQTDKPTTLDFILTPDGENWDDMKSKVEWVINQIAKLTPNEINIGKTA